MRCYKTQGLKEESVSCRRTLFSKGKEDDRLAFHLREFHMKEIVFVGSEDFCQKSQEKQKSSGIE